ncbi:protein tyrosine phosphatase domain-containing protein 1-like isoform X2 [Liolophura sinensis]|uniref:protein tyrosine phosphatase domain-containing protein 1-like isoform X2 n=1 Tax=Liolophura sinensis TaxID=3198878 RepID=UPI0031584073
MKSHMDPDECGHPGLEDIQWEDDIMKSVSGRAAGAKYSKFSEGARHLLSEEKQCALFCRGKKCKYCTADSWTDDQKAIKGLYSHWVTDNILAMARPSTQGIETYKIIDQFKEAGIKSVINIQKPGEHASCGEHLDESGFSYNPQLFMDNDVFFYNFGWPDYGVASLSTILNMVKVMQFAVMQGKVAIHCHAGLGRTGVLISCYLVFTNRMNPNEAIHYVRSKRPNAIQTSTQVQCVQEFGQYLTPLRVVFASRSKEAHEFTFNQFLNRQRHILHGYESRRLKYLPKIIFVVCERLLELSGCQHVISRSSTPSSVTSEIRKTKPVAASGLQSDVLHLPVSLHKSHSMLELTEKGLSPGLSHSKSDQQLNKIDPDQPFTNGYCEDDDTEKDDVSLPILETGAPLESGKPGIAARNEVAEALAVGVYDTAAVKEKLIELEEELNASDKAWQQLSEENDPLVLSGLLWDWLNHLKEPVLRAQDISTLLDHVDDPDVGLKRLEKGICVTVEYLMKVLVHLQPLEEELEDRVFEILLSHLTHKTVRHDPVLSPTPHKPDHWGELKGSAAKKLFHFFYKLLDLVEQRQVKPQHSSQSVPANGH